MNNKEVDLEVIGSTLRRIVSDWRARLCDRTPFLAACGMLVVLMAIYGSLRKNASRLKS